MSTNATGAVPAIVQRAIVGAVLVYFAVFIYAIVADDGIARIVAYVLFGFIAIGVGALLLSQSRSSSGGGDDGSVVTAAGVALVVGGVAQLGWVATGTVVLDLLSTIAVVVGMGLYVYAVRIAN